MSQVSYNIEFADDIEVLCFFDFFNGDYLDSSLTSEQMAVLNLQKLSGNYELLYIDMNVLVSEDKESRLICVKNLRLGKKEYFSVYSLKEIDLANGKKQRGYVRFFVLKKGTSIVVLGIWQVFGSNSLLLTGSISSGLYKVENGKHVRFNMLEAYGESYTGSATYVIKDDGVEYVFMLSCG